MSETTSDVPTTEEPVQNDAPHTEAPVQPPPTADGFPEDVILKLQEEVRLNLDGWQRARAEFANYKKRVESEMKSAQERGAHDALIRMLPILDDFDRALANIPDELKDNAWVNGTSLIMKHFDKLLEAYHVEAIDPTGETFDPHRHEAIGMDADSGLPSGTVTATMQKGYVSGDRVLRPALVKVAS